MIIKNIVISINLMFTLALYCVDALHFDRAFYGRGDGLPIVMDNLFCIGRETHLVNCSYQIATTTFDTHSEDVGVKCFPQYKPGDNCSLGELRLVNGTTEYEGRVELCIGGVWGDICNLNWDQRESQIVCRELGYSEAGE